ncbi:hypothetical protein [Filomicrobium sp.]|nr:hypothetical protein [Filomicrobium sp.]MCV0371119.1 hypothetical protein [Filomicrobium sp.]
MTDTYTDGLEAAAKLAERFMGPPNDCDQLGSMDMETGVIDLQHDLEEVL